MAAKDLFALAGTISVDSSGAVKNIDKATDAAKQSESKFESSFKNIARAAVMYLSATAIWNFGKSMVQAAADVQAESAQFEAAFSKVKNGTDLADEAFSRLENTTGTLASRLKVTGTKVFSQFTGAGIEGAEAIGLMEEYMSLATDGAAYYDMSLEEVDERLRSFLRGNTEAGDAIGLFTSETQRNEKAVEMYGEKFINLTEAQKQMVMLDISKSIYEASGATGQAARESESYTNVVANLKEQWRQFLATAGAPLLEALIPILQSLGDLIKMITPAVTWLTTQLVAHKDVILAVMAGIVAAYTAYGVYKGVLATVNTIEKISNTLKVLSAGAAALKTGATLAETKATMAATAAQRGLNTAMLANPITWIVLLIGALVAAIVLLWKNCDGFRNFWKKAWDDIKNASAKSQEAIKIGWDQTKKYFNSLWRDTKAGAIAAGNSIKSAFTKAWNGVKNAWSNAKAFFVGVWNKIKGAFGTVKNTFTNIFKNAWNGVKNAFNGVKTFFNNIVNNIVNAFSNIGTKIANKFKGIGSKIKEKFSNIGSGIKNLLGFRTGGVFTGESAIRVAEYPNATTNPEIVTPQRIMRDTFADTLENYNLKASGSGDNSRVEALLEKLISLFGQQKIVLSTGELVGALTPRMDKALGERSTKKERGRV